MHVAVLVVLLFVEGGWGGDASQNGNAQEDVHNKAMKGVEAGIAAGEGFGSIPSQMHIEAGAALLSRLKKEETRSPVTERVQSSESLLKELKLEVKERVHEMSEKELEANTATATSALGPRGGDPNVKKAADHGDELLTQVFDWGYGHSNGPANWGNRYQLCATGKRQSPVSISEEIASPTARDFSTIALLQWQFPKSAHAFTAKGDDVDAGPKIFLALPVNSRFKDGARALLESPVELYGRHTFEVEQLGSPSLFIDGSSYKLKRIVTRTPAEHMLDDKTYPLEIQLVHEPEGPGDHAHGHVGVSVLFDDASQENAQSPAFVNELANAADHATFKPAELVRNLHFAEIADSIRSSLAEYFQYKGSLTTPPCSEDTLWFVARRPLPVAKADVAALRRLEGHNARPLQALNGRVIELVQ